MQLVGTDGKGVSHSASGMRSHVLAGEAPPRRSLCGCERRGDKEHEEKNSACKLYFFSSSIAEVRGKEIERIPDFFHVKNGYTDLAPPCRS